MRLKAFHCDISREKIENFRVRVLKFTFDEILQKISESLNRVNNL